MLNSLTIANCLRFFGIGLATLTLGWPGENFDCRAQDENQSGLANSVHDSNNASRQFKLHPELEVNLFAAEPMLANPTNIDIDQRGRVWVCEVVNYRHFANGDAKPRDAGDRILILEDTDGDAIADRETIFYQGRDIDSAHGICVLGDRALVSANDSVFYLIDTDGDLKADQKQLLFTGISGVQHDHGIHAFVFGPDGKLYFNFGNEGRQICDATGKLIVDLSGRPVQANLQPYNQGMIFRCNLDGSEFETLAWNFRNNWELCVDSFGSIWQSDNDDDGNRATRINFVIPFGDYGYTEQGTGRGWNSPRTNLEEDIPSRHWHLNDPGVMPNLLVTGAGSPTGIVIYEGAALPNIFQNQLIHCDAGPSVVRAYPVKKSGAGYTAEVVNLLDAAEVNPWFRPSDVCVAPDGSLIIADWYDPGVGGHRMQDTQRGRLFHVTRRGAGGKYGVPAADFSTPQSAALGLKSPNQATRYMAWVALEKFGLLAHDAVAELYRDGNPRIQARALWMLVHLGLPNSQLLSYLHESLQDSNPDLRATAVRVCVHLRNELPLPDLRDHLNFDDPAAEVRRELLIGLRQWPSADLPQAWSRLARQYNPDDRWYLESLGIAAAGNWNDCLTTWLTQDEKTQASLLSSPAGRNIIWRSRATQTPELIAKIISDDLTSREELPKFYRALDLLDPAQTKPVLLALAFGPDREDSAKTDSIVLEAVSRLVPGDLSADQTAPMQVLIEKTRGTDRFISFVDRFSSTAHYADLLKMSADSSDRQQAANAMGVLLDKEQQEIVQAALIQADETAQVVLGDALVNCGRRPAAIMLGGIAKRTDIDRSIRTSAISRLGQIQSGAEDILGWIDRREELDPLLMPAIQAALHNSQSAAIRQRANELFPLANAKDNRPLPAISELASRPGESSRGEVLFTGVGTCARCHLINGKGIEVGPDLSGIGNKLSREAMYESILFPSAGISHNYESWLVQTLDGNLLTGILLSETDSEIQLKNDQGIRLSIPRTNVEASRKQQLSMMPDNLHKELSEQDLVDLIEYLMVQKAK